jgi:hypothetical protein
MLIDDDRDSNPLERQPGRASRGRGIFGSSALRADTKKLQFMIEILKAGFLADFVF